MKASALESPYYRRELACMHKLFDEIRLNSDHKTGHLLASKTYISNNLRIHGTFNTVKYSELIDFQIISM